MRKIDAAAQKSLLLSSIFAGVISGLVPAPSFGQPMTQPNTFVYIGTNYTGQYSIAPRPPGVTSSFENYFGTPPPATEVAASGGSRFVFATNNFGTIAHPESAVWYAYEVAGGQTVYVVPGTGFVDPRSVGHFADTPGGGTVVNSGRVYPVEELRVSPTGEVLSRRYIPDVNPAVVERQNRLLDLARDTFRPPPPGGTGGTGSTGPTGPSGTGPARPGGLPGTGPSTGGVPGGGAGLGGPRSSPFTSPEGIRAGQLIRDLRYTPPPTVGSQIASAASTALNVAILAQAAYSGPRNAANLMNAYLDPAGTAAAIQSGQLRVYDFVPFLGGNPAAEIVIGIVDPIFNDFSRAEGVLGTAGAVLLIPVRIIEGGIINPIAAVADLGVTGLAHVFAAAGNAFCRLTGLCDPNLCVRGSQGCQGRGGSNGDPHMATYDGYSYDLQAVGELILTTDGSDFMVQVRQGPWGDSTRVAVNTAVAMQVGSNRVAYHTGAEIPFVIDGVPTPNVRSGFMLSGGGRIDAVSGAFDVSWLTGERLHAGISGDHLDISVSPAPDQLGRLSGLLGNFDGDAHNDFTKRDGTLLDSPLSFIDLYNVFANEWRVSPHESLFDYAPGEGTETFTDLDFPREPVSAAGLPADRRAAAEAACVAAGVVDPNILEGCILDVAVTNDPVFAEGAAGIPPPNGALVNTCPEGRDLVSYGAGNFQYLVTGAPPEGWQDPGFDDSAWATSSGRLGNLAGCGEPSPNIWPAHTDAIVRVRFELSDACGLQIGFSINDQIVEAYLNGRPILAHPYFHQRCAGFDDLVLNPPRSAWTTGENILAVRVRSNLDTPSYDHRVSIGQFSGPEMPECAATDPTCDGLDDDCNGEVDEDYLPRDTSCGLGVCVSSGRSSCVLGRELDDCVPLDPPPGDISCLGPNVTRFQFQGYTRNGNDGDRTFGGVEVEVAATGVYSAYGVLCRATSSGGLYVCTGVVPDPLDVIEVEYRSTLFGSPFAAPEIVALELTPGGANVNYVQRDLTGFPTTLVIQGSVRGSTGQAVPYASVAASGDVSGSVQADQAGNYRLSIPVSDALGSVSYSVIAQFDGLSSDPAVRTTVLSPSARVEEDVDLFFSERRLRFLGRIGNANDPTGDDGLNNMRVVLQKDGAVFCDRGTFPRDGQTYNYLCPDLEFTGGDAFEVAYSISGQYGATTGTFLVDAGDIPAGGSEADYRFDLELPVTTLWVHGQITDSTGAGITGATARIDTAGYGSFTAVAAGGYYERYIPIYDGVTSVSGTIQGSDGANSEQRALSVAVAPNAVTPVVENFSFASDTVGTGRWGFAANSSGGDQAPAVAADGTIYHAADRQLYAINPDGTERWRHTLATYYGFGTCSPLLGSNGIVYAGDSNGVVHAVNATSGAGVWTYYDYGYGYGSIQALARSSSGTIYVAKGGWLIALDEGGDELWAREMVPNGYDTIQNVSVGRDGAIYAQSYRELVAFNADGSRRWTYGGLGYLGSPAIGADGTIYVMSGDRLVALDMRGEPEWSAPIGSPSSNVAIGPTGELYVAENDRLHVLTALGVETMTATIAEGQRFASTTPAVGDDGTVYLVSYESDLVAIDAATGLQVFDFASSSHYLFEPVVGTGGTVYVIGNDRLYAINAPSAALADSPWPKIHRDLGNNGAADYAPEATRFVELGGVVTHANIPGLALFGFDVEVRDEDGRLCNARSLPGGFWSCTGPTARLDEHQVSISVSGLGTTTASVSALVPAGGAGATTEVTVDLLAEVTTLVITGRVSGEEGEGIAGAKIEVLYAGDLDGDRATDVTGAPLPRDYQLSGAPYATADAAGDYVIYLHYGEQVAEIDLSLRASAGLNGSRTENRFVALTPRVVGTEIVNFTLVNRGVDWVFNLLPESPYSYSTYYSSNSRPVLTSSGAIYLSARVSENFGEGTYDYNRLWSISTDGALLGTFDSFDYRMPSEPFVAEDGNVYFTDSQVWALSPDLSSALWSYQAGNGGDLSKPAAAADGTVYYVTDDGGLTRAYAIAPDGSEVWAYDLPYARLTAPLLDGSDLLIGAAGALYALDVDASAATRLRYSTQVVPSTEWWSSFVPVSTGAGGIVAAVDDQAIGVTVADGALAFTQMMPGYSNGEEPAVAADGTIFIASGSSIVALEPTGVIRWTFDTGYDLDGSAAAGPDGEVYVVADGRLLAIGDGGGVPDVLWTFENPGARLFGTPSADDAHVYVLGDDGYLYAVSRTGAGGGELPPPPPPPPALAHE